MSYFDLDPRAADDILNQARSTPGADTEYGATRKFFLGTYDDPIEGGLNTAASLAHGVYSGLVAKPALLLGDAATPSLTPVAKSIDQYFGGSTVEDWLLGEQKKNLEMVQAVMPDSHTGTLGNILFGAGDVVPEALVGGAIGTVKGGPGIGTLVGGATLPGIIQGYAEKRLAEARGIDSDTAIGMGLITGVSTAAGVALPGGVAGSLAKSIGVGILSNVPLGMAQRGLTGELLADRGYTKEAEQYRAMDGEAILTDTVLGAAFGVLGARAHPAVDTSPKPDYQPATPMERGEIPPAVVDSALASESAAHVQTGTAPGVPADPLATANHVAAMNKATDDLTAGREVDVSETGVADVGFVPVRAEQTAAVTAAMQDMHPLHQSLNELDELRAQAHAMGIELPDDPMFAGRVAGVADIGELPVVSKGATPVELPRINIGPDAPEFEAEIVGPAREAAAQGNAESVTLKDGRKVSLVIMKKADEGRIIALASDGKLVGDLSYYTTEEAPGIRTNPSVEVGSEFKRQGVGMAMYDLAEKHGAMIPDLNQEGQIRTPEGRAFREARARKQAASGNVTGRRAQVFVGDRPEPVRFQVVEADSLAPAIGKAENQYRDRTRVASELQITKIAGNLQFGRLGDAPTMAEGAPTLAKDGRIVGGNGRVAAVRRAYEAGSADSYREQLTSRAAEFGLDPAQVQGMRQPVLVRRFENDVNVREAAILSNEGGTLEMSALEQAKVDAERMPSMAALELPESGDLNAASVRDFMRQWLANIPGEQHGRLVSSDGKMSPEGLLRARNALLYKAYGDSPTLARLIDSSDEAQKNVANALVKSAANVADAREAIESGDLHDLDIQPQILQAVDKYAELRESGMTVDQFADQGDLYGNYVGPESVALMRFMEANKRSAKAIAEAISGYYDQVRALGNPKQANIFDAQPPSRAQILDHVLGKEESAPNVKNELMIDENARGFEYIINDASVNNKGIVGARHNEIGRIIGNRKSSRDGDSLRITTAVIGDKFKGKGRGLAAYADLVDQAAAKGMHVESDIELTQAAARVYEKLAERGYDVQRNPNARLEDVDGEMKLVSTSGPVFKVYAKPESAEMRGPVTVDEAKVDLLTADEGRYSISDEGGKSLRDVVSEVRDSGISMSAFEKGSSINLSKIVVPESERGTGKGTAAMQSIIDYADRTGKTIELTPSADFGGNKKRLTEFYKRFGFVENKGANKDFTISESMYRPVQERHSIAGTIDVDGVERQTANSNGQPIHPTEEGVRNFWRWFGNSTVVDDQGRPQVMHHGTGRAFTEFSPASNGTNTGYQSADVGFFLTASPDLASMYADGAAKRAGGDASVMPLYLRIERPKFYESSSQYYRELDAQKKAGVSGEQWRKQLEDEGYDGVIVRDDKEEVIAFEPNQIKSATVNTGEFSAGDADIRYSKGEQVGAAAQLNRDPLIKSLVDAGKIVIHPDSSTLPSKRKDGVLGFTAPDGTIHVVEGANANSVLLHEAFHSGAESLLGGDKWAGLMQNLDALRTGQDTDGFWRGAADRVKRAGVRDDSPLVNEEFGAYAIENYDKAPDGVRKWVDNVIGAVKEWLLRRFGVQAGDVTPGQLHAIAKAALRSMNEPNPSAVKAGEARGKAQADTAEAGKAKELDPVAANQAKQILVEMPNATAVDDAGQLRTAGVLLGEAEVNMAQAEQDAPGYDAAVACALRV